MPNPYTHFTVHVPLWLTHGERMEIGQKVIEHIVKRTRKDSKDKDGKDFSGYSKSYKNSLDFKNFKHGSKVDLTLTGDMLDTLEILSDMDGLIDIGYHAGSAEEGKVEGNVRGTYGNQFPIKGKARNFLGIENTELNKIIDEVTQAGKAEKLLMELNPTIEEQVGAVLNNIGIEVEGVEDFE